MDRGKTWTKYKNGEYPTVAVYDLQIHPRELDLIIGTHGRSIWTLPVRALEELTEENRQNDVYFTTPGDMYLFHTKWDKMQFNERQPGGISKNTQPGTLFCYYLKKDLPGKAIIKITDAAGNKVFGNELEGGTKSWFKCSSFRKIHSNVFRPNKRGR